MVTSPVQSISLSSKFIPTLGIASIEPIQKVKKIAHLLFKALTFQFFQIKDYNDPEKLNSYRKTANHQTFQQVVNAHGLQRTLQHKILSSNLLMEKLKVYLKTLPVIDLVKLHHTVGAISKNFPFSELNQDRLTSIFKKQMPCTLQTTPIVPMLQQTTIDLLQESPVFDQNCFGICSKNLKKEHTKRQKQLEENIEKHYRGKINKLSNSFQNVSSKLKPNEKNFFKKELEPKLSCLQNLSLNQAIASDQLSYWDSFSPPEGCSKTLSTCITSLEALMKDILCTHSSALRHHLLETQEHHNNLKRLNTPTIAQLFKKMIKDFLPHQNNTMQIRLRKGTWCDVCRN